MSYIFLLSLGMQRARLDAHSEVYLMQALGALEGWPVTLPGPRVGPFDAQSGPIPYLPYLMSLIFGSSIFSLLMFKGLLNVLALYLMAMLLRRELSGSCESLAALSVLALGSSVLLDAEALTLRYTSFLTVFIVIYLYALQRFVTSTGSSLWLAIATTVAGLLPSFHLLTSTLGIMLLGAIWLQREHLRKRVSMSVLAIVPGLVILAPLLINTAGALVAGTPELESVGSAGPDSLDRIVFAFHTLVSRWPSYAAVAVSYATLVLFFVGFIVLTRSVFTQGVRGFSILVVVQVPLALVVFVLVGGYAMKEYYLYAFAIPFFVAGALGLNTLLSPLSYGRYVSFVVAIIATIVGLELTFLERAQGRYPPSALAAERVIDDSVMRYGLDTSTAETHFHGFLRSGDAGVRYLFATSRLRAKNNLAQRTPLWRVAVIPEFINATPLYVGRFTYQKALFYYQSAVLYDEVIDQSGCTVSLPYHRMTLAHEEQAAVYGIPVRQELCASASSAQERTQLTIPLRSGTSGNLNIVLGLGAGDRVKITAVSQGGAPLQVTREALPERWPNRWFTVAIPERPKATQVTLELSGTAGLNLLDIF